MLVPGDPTSLTELGLVQNVTPRVVPEGQHLKDESLDGF